MRNVMSEAYEVTVLLRHPKSAVLATLDFLLHYLYITIVFTKTCFSEI